MGAYGCALDAGCSLAEFDACCPGMILLRYLHSATCCCPLNGQQKQHINIKILLEAKCNIMHLLVQTTACCQVMQIFWYHRHHRSCFYTMISHRHMHVMLRRPSVCHFRLQIRCRTKQCYRFNVIACILTLGRHLAGFEGKNTPGSSWNAFRRPVSNLLQLLLRVLLHCGCLGIHSITSFCHLGHIASTCHKPLKLSHIHKPNKPRSLNSFLYPKQLVDLNHAHTSPE